MVVLLSLTPIADYPEHRHRCRHRSQTGSQAKGTQIEIFAKTASLSQPERLIESFGEGEVLRNNNRVKIDKQRRLHIGPMEKVAQPDGQVVAANTVMPEIEPVAGDDS